MTVGVRQRDRSPIKQSSVDRRPLGRAIELAAALPALANRAALCALWATTLKTKDKAKAEKIRQRFRAAIDTFTAVCSALRQGDDALGIDADTAALLEERIWSEKGVCEDLDGFVGRAYYAHTLLAGPALADFEEAQALADLASGALSTRLEQVAEAVRAVFEQQSAETIRNTEASRELTARTIQNLDDLTMKIQLISVNASVEASRAGVAGASFGVIAKEISALSYCAQSAVDEIRKGFSELS